jgi:hypothetical protein
MHKDSAQVQATLPRQSSGSRLCSSTDSAVGVMVTSYFPNVGQRVQFPHGALIFDLLPRNLAFFWLPSLHGMSNKYFCVATTGPNTYTCI